MTYDKTYYSGVVVSPCEEPPSFCLHEGLEWDAGNLAHCTRLTPLEIQNGVDRGYLLYEEDEIDCRYRVLFQHVPPLEPGGPQWPVYRLILDTSAGRMRPVTVFPETRAGALQDFFQAKRDGELT
ncbi:hypothetical protein ACFQDE_16220 [Deinococcus caeni]|uniref:Uncharacterized protein n=1 Tax=Deinococcus caeni TaxID=569127 RepID=A0ABP9U8T3_9DEIO